MRAKRAAICLTLAFVIASPAPLLAQDAAAPIVACEVMGHDLILYNRGEAELIAGTIIHWSAWNGKREGDHKLDAPLVPFVGLRVSGALGASYLWDRPCAASVVTPASPAAYVGPEQGQDKRNGTIHLQGGQGNLPAPTSN